MPKPGGTVAAKPGGAAVVAKPGGTTAAAKPGSGVVAGGRPAVASPTSPTRGLVAHAAAAAERAATLRQATAALAAAPLATPLATPHVRALNEAAALAAGGGGGGGGTGAAAPPSKPVLGLGLPEGSDEQINAIRATHGGRPLTQLELAQFRRLQQVRQAEARRANNGGGLRPLPVHVVLPQHQKRWVESRSGRWKADSSAGQPPPMPLNGRVSPGRRPPSPGPMAAAVAVAVAAPAAAETFVTEADLQKAQETPPAQAQQEEREKSWWERMTS